MKHLFTFLLAVVLAFSANAQAYTAPIRYNNGVPTAPPSNNGSRIYVDMLTGFRYNWNQTTSTWQKDADGVLQIAGASAPLAAPGYGQPRLAMNNPTPPATPDLYVWVGPGGADWVCLSCAESTTVTAGDGIAVSGTPPDITISNTGDLSAANELNTSFGVVAGNLRLIDAAGTLSVPVTSIAPDQSATNEIQTLSIVGNTLSLSSGGGSVAVDPSSSNEIQSLSLSGRTLGISAGNTVTLPNDLQTISRTGQTVSLSQSGGSFSLPIIDVVAGADISVDVVGGVATVSSTGGGGDGNGIYDGSGTVPGGTVVSLESGSFFFDASSPMADGELVNFGDAGNNVLIQFGNSTLALFAGDAGITMFSDGGDGEFAMNAGGGSIYLTKTYGSIDISSTSAGISINDSRAVKKGLEYATNHSATLVSNARSLPDVGAVNLMLGSGTTVTGATSALANAAAATAGVPVGGPYRWDDGSSVHLMFRK